jgi:hypothetical protein
MSKCEHTDRAKNLFTTPARVITVVKKSVQEVSYKFFHVTLVKESLTHSKNVFIKLLN